MKDLTHRTNFLQSRQIKPKLQTAPTKALPVHSLELFYDQDETYITIYPSKVSIRAKEILDMIDCKNEYIKLAGSEFCIEKNDIFSALQLHANQSKYSSTIETVSVTADLEFSPPKRPTNAFILYRSTWGKIVRLMFHEFNNSQVSKFLGAMWKWSSNQLKEKYIQQAHEYRKMYKEKCPNYEYNRKKDEESKNIPVESYIGVGDNYPDWHQANDVLLYSMEHEYINDFRDNTCSDKAFNSNDYYLHALQIHHSPIVPDISNNEWEKVCNIISDLLPSSTTEDKFIDDQLWASLQSAGFPYGF